jgi:ribosomal protein S18 acetylase RimI-like enzyme
MKTTGLSIIPAESAQHIDQVRALFLEYWASRKLSLAVFNFERELAGLPGEYARPAGRLLLASCDGEVAGCVALRQIEPQICEMKRLYVRGSFRGRGFGRLLAEAIIAEARSHGYRKMRLDTITPTMQEAVSLYKKLKFQAIPPYRHNPLEGVSYMELDL